MRNYRRAPRRSRPPYRVDSTRPVRHAVYVAERDLKRLGEAIYDARERLGLTQEEFAERAGLSLKTVQRVENGLAAPRAKTFKGLDQGAQWKTGSARGVLEGREPTPIDPPDHGHYPAELFDRVPSGEVEHEMLAIRGETDDVKWSYILDRRKRLYDEKLMGRKRG